MKNVPEYKNKGIILAIVVAALGYFVDIYDLILFGVVRIPSLNGIGIDHPDEITRVGEILLNFQMAGMLIGGVIWGILGDKRGRLSVLFGSIFLYSIANLANGFVHNVPAYAVFRLLAGIGLAGELGAGITLVSEIMSKETRGYGTTVVAAFGLMGAIVAGLVGNYDWNIQIGSNHIANWRMAYIVGGILGFVLLVLRIGVYESGMYTKVKKDNVKKGDLRQLLFNRSNFFKYLNCILIGLPLWFIIGTLIFQAPEFARSFGITDPINAGTAIMLAYSGLVVGDIASGLISQWMKSRRKAVFVFLVICAISTVYYLLLENVSVEHFYTVCFTLGFSVGYWAVFVTIGAEQFGTNLRATVTTTVPNFVRGSLVPLSITFIFFRDVVFDSYTDKGNIYSAMIVASMSLIVAFVSLYYLKETFGKDLDYVES